MRVSKEDADTLKNYISISTKSPYGEHFASANYSVVYYNVLQMSCSLEKILGAFSLFDIEYTESSDKELMARQTVRLEMRQEFRGWVT
tara:strand:- start:2386 stop:2649 length:264 start_codon:yes stop_codon:yes gene_type:complete